MKAVSMIGLYLTMMFLLGASAAASASATDLLFVPEHGGFPFAATGSSNTGAKLEATGGTKIECAITRADIKITDAHSGQLHVLWLGCSTTLLGGGSCWSPSLSEGSILITAQFHLGLGHRGSETKVPAVLVLVPAVYEVICNVVSIEMKIPIKGSVIGEIKVAGLNKMEEKLSFVFKETSGKQDMTTFQLSKLTNEALMEHQHLNTTFLAKEEESGEEVSVPLENSTKEKLELKVK